ncbi:hypothetical protein [Bradyrhizobium sp.]|uniref:hypothetical protein n=1 Tax=Bradyrhizobium sp. TaxID=376 RepID=UPI002736628D|nr:hypothetical protein [Bradyrhizobium sp.]MDP3692913.1 hypothetical protein [Bradyrhizobium sp.]
MQSHEPSVAEFNASKTTATFRSRRSDGEGRQDEQQRPGERTPLPLLPVRDVTVLMEEAGA